MCLYELGLCRLAGSRGPIRGDQKISRYNPAILFDRRQVEGETELGGDSVLSLKLLTEKEGGKDTRKRESERERRRE